MYNILYVHWQGVKMMHREREREREREKERERNEKASH